MANCFMITPHSIKMTLPTKFWFRFSVQLLFTALFIAGICIACVPIEERVPVYTDVYNASVEMEYDISFIYHKYENLTTQANLGISVFMAIVGFFGLLVSWSVFCGLGVCCNCCECCKRKIQACAVVTTVQPTAVQF